MSNSSDIYSKDETPPLAKRRRRREKSTGSPQGALVDFPDTEYFHRREEGGPAAASSDPSLSAHGSAIHRHHHHRRRSSSPGHSWSDIGNRILWLGLALATVVYVIVLLTLRVGRPLKRAAPESPAAVTLPATSDRTSPTTSPDDLAKTIHERIQVLGKAPAVIKDARRLAETGHSEAALTRLEEAIAATPNMIDLKILLAEILFNRKEYTPALDVLTQILEIDPGHRPAKDMLGKALLRENNFPAALEVADWILEDDPHSILAHQIAAAAYLNLDKTALAIPHLKAVVLYDPADTVALNNLGVAYARAGVFTEAIATFNDLLEKNAANAVTYYNLSACYAGQSLPESVVSTLQRAELVFGAAFVAAWIDNRDFDAVRETGPFKEYAATRQGTLSSSATNLATLQLIDPLHSANEGLPRTPEELLPLRR